MNEPIIGPCVGHYYHSKHPHPVETCGCDICADVRRQEKADAAVRKINSVGQPCYLVLSVKDLRRMLRASEKRAELHARGDAHRIGNACFSFESTVRPDSKGVLQVGSFDIAKGPR